MDILSMNLPHGQMTHHFIRSPILVDIFVWKIREAQKISSPKCGHPDLQQLLVRSSVDLSCLHPLMNSLISALGEEGNTLSYGAEHYRLYM